MKIEDVEISYHRGTQGCPMVNVKNWHGIDDAALVEIVRENIDDPRVDAMTNEDVVAVVRGILERDCGWEQAAAENGWEEATELARELFGDHVKVWGAGRSGGWCVVEGLPPVPDVDDIPDDPDDYDANVAWWVDHLDDWSTFADGVRAIADDWPRRTVELLAINVPDDIAGRVARVHLTIVLGDQDIASAGDDVVDWDWAGMLKLADSTLTVRVDR